MANVRIYHHLGQHRLRSKLTLKCGSIQLEFERMIKVKPIN